mgnify:CR=1 FL=1
MIASRLTVIVVANFIVFVLACVNNADISSPSLLKTPDAFKLLSKALFKSCAAFNFAVSSGIDVVPVYLLATILFLCSITLSFIDV